MKPGNGTIRFPRRAEASQSRRSVLLPVMAWALLVTTSLTGQPPKPNEYQVKAAYIYNFGKFVKWPASSAVNQGNSFTICVLGDDPFGSVLQSTLAGESVDGMTVTIKRIPKPEDASGCRILSLGATEESHLRQILAALGQTPVLTVSDIPDFSKRGGMIQFVMEGSRVRFEINRTSAESAGLILPSELLKVAAAVRGTGRTGDQ
jgi:hypothetical protein